MERHMSRIAVCTVAGAVAVLAACGTGSSASPSRTAEASVPAQATGAGSGSSSPTISAGSPSAGRFDPTDYVAVIDNPWFPLSPGTTWTYRGTKDGEPAVDVFTATAMTKVVDGITCLVVQDRLKLSGVLAERTLDYYAQDRAGNVWYFGEDTAELDEEGKVTSTEGTWHSGVDGARAGIFMEATPTVGRELEQEHYAGHAEDRFEVIDLRAKVSVPFGVFADALLTKEWTPLEPEILDHKYYVRGVGEVREVSVKGPKEELSLVSVAH
jgi:hypothetical protein